VYGSHEARLISHAITTEYKSSASAEISERSDYIENNVYSRPEGQS